MLDTVTKRRIDTARDILVGKVPDPKSQVEQITIALIYKFMDDMDADSEELGGKRTFFAGDYERYGWAKLMRAGLGGFETLNLYSEAIQKMPENPGIPALFRDIFKNAYLPYRDPETLKSFLKIIDEFEYDHSERLGDAFEYLLSVLGSQGDAGQFRTPRHIIDFMVEILAPKKNDTVLDPACGTAGFLISAYKHIVNANKDASGHSTLTPDDLGRLAQNFKGYDISPDMVRLSLVNLYLHGFTDPHIYEYDSLTSEERWNETADVILANPPFMSPKGGIRPHQRFSIQAKRSEVLFVDYIAEHLNANGRAAIIVPEGIIFQSQTAYVQLRKLLVQNSLVAVISLPAGMFNPYSGVKTSILILDKALAKQAQTVGFFKIENDGFSLGAQRREGGKDDLPGVKAEIEGYLGALRARQPLDELKLQRSLVVSREAISANGDYNLSGARYRESSQTAASFPTVPIGEICELINGRAFKPEDWEHQNNGGLPIIRIQNLNNPEGEFNYFSGEVRDRFIVNTGDLLFSWSGSRGTSFGAHIWNGSKAILNQHIFNVKFDEDRAAKMYLLEALNKAVVEVEENLHGGVGLVHITKGNLEKIQIPLPPLDVQKEIVAEIEGYQKVINGARAVLDNYRPHIAVRAEWPVSKLCDVAEIVMGQSPAGESYNKVGNGVPLINGPVEFGPEPFSNTIIIQYTTEPSKMCKKGDLILCVRGSTTGRMNIAGYNSCIGRGVAAIRSENSQDWINFVISTMRDKIYKMGVGSTFPNVSSKDIGDLAIPFPPIEIQRTIVAEINTEQALVAANRELITRFEAKIQAALARVWGEAETKATPALRDSPSLAKSKA